MVTMPPDVVLTLASSTVFVKASSLVKRDFGAIVSGARQDLRERNRALEGLRCDDEVVRML